MKEVLTRINKGFEDLGPGNHLIFGHSATMHLMLREF